MLRQAQHALSMSALKSTIAYLPITTAAMLKAADLWASARKAGIPAADPKALDADMILAAQTAMLGSLVGNFRYFEAIANGFARLLPRARSAR